MYYDQGEGDDQNSTRTMEATTSRPQKTTSKTLLTEDLLRQSGVSQKVIQRLPAYIVEQSMNHLEEAEIVEDSSSQEILMPLIKLTEIEPEPEIKPELQVPELEAETETETEEEIESVPVVEKEENTLDREAKIKGRKGFLFRADAA